MLFSIGCQIKLFDLIDMNKFVSNSFENLPYRMLLRLLTSSENINVTKETLLCASGSVVWSIDFHLNVERTIIGSVKNKTRQGWE